MSPKRHRLAGFSPQPGSFLNRDDYSATECPLAIPVSAPSERKRVIGEEENRRTRRRHAQSNVLAAGQEASL